MSTYCCSSGVPLWIHGGANTFAAAKAKALSKYHNIYKSSNYALTGKSSSSSNTLICGTCPPCNENDCITMTGAGGANAHQINGVWRKMRQANNAPNCHNGKSVWQFFDPTRWMYIVNGYLWFDSSTSQWRITGVVGGGTTGTDPNIQAYPTQPQYSDCPFVPHNSSFSGVLGTGWALTKWMFGGSSIFMSYGGCSSSSYPSNYAFCNNYYIQVCASSRCSTSPGLGACCHMAGWCYTTTEAECNANHGTWKGTNVQCDYNTCGNTTFPPPPPPPNLVNKNCCNSSFDVSTVQAMMQKFPDGLAYSTGGGTCAARYDNGTYIDGYGLNMQSIYHLEGSPGNPLQTAPPHTSATFKVHHMGMHTGGTNKWNVRPDMDFECMLHSVRYGINKFPWYDHTRPEGQVLIYRAGHRAVGASSIGLSYPIHPQSSLEPIPYHGTHQNLGYLTHWNHLRSEGWKVIKPDHLVPMDLHPNPGPSNTFTFPVLAREISTTEWEVTMHVKKPRQGVNVLRWFGIVPGTNGECKVGMNFATNFHRVYKGHLRCGMWITPVGPIMEPASWNILDPNGGCVLKAGGRGLPRFYVNDKVIEFRDEAPIVGTNNYKKSSRYKEWNNVDYYFNIKMSSSLTWGNWGPYHPTKPCNSSTTACLAAGWPYVATYSSGACCVYESSHSYWHCHGNKTLIDCHFMGGVWQGPGTTCNSINCNCPSSSCIFLKAC